jgi:D-inositol-3-phosphate glycosyltransferase
MMTDDYPPGLLTGIGRHTKELAECLSGLGVEVCVVKGGEVDDGFIRGRLAILGVEPSAAFASLGWREGPFNLPHLVHVNLAMVQRILAMERPRYDVVHIHDIFAALAGFTVARVLGLPTVLTKHFCFTSPRGDQRAGDSLKYFMRLEEWSLQSADQLIAVSSHLQRIILSRDDRLGKKCAVVTSGTNIGAERSQTGRPASRERLAGRLGIKRPLGFVMLQVGRLVYVKGIDVALHALAALAREAQACDPLLVLIGTGAPENEQYLRGLAAQLGVAGRLYFGGPEHSRSVLADLYRAADAVVVPSRAEWFPLVVAEATTLRRLVLAADVGGMGEQIVHMQNGLLFPHGQDPVMSGTALALLVKWVLRNPSEASRIAAYGPLRGESAYSWPRVASDVVSIYRNITSGSDWGAARG